MQNTKRVVGFDEDICEAHSRPTQTRGSQSVAQCGGKEAASTQPLFPQADTEKEKWRAARYRRLPTWIGEPAPRCQGVPCCSYRCWVAKSRCPVPGIPKGANTQAQNSKWVGSPYGARRGQESFTVTVVARNTPALVQEAAPRCAACSRRCRRGQTYWVHSHPQSCSPHQTTQP